MRHLEGLLLLVVVSGSLAGCTTTIVPPPAVTDAAPVFVLDHGRHSTLVLPRPGGAVRYAYGDWRWYAEAQTGLAAGSSGALASTQGALGRRQLPPPVTESGVLGAIGVGVEAVYPLRVEAAEAETLRRDLEALYAANRATRLRNRFYHLDFVHHPEPYSAAHNSNHKVAEWLRRMGCRIEGAAFWSSWRVVPE